MFVKLKWFCKKFFRLSLKQEKSPRGKKTFKFCHHCRVYMLGMLNFGFSTCFHCSEVVRRLSLFLTAIGKHRFHHPCECHCRAVLIWDSLLQEKLAQVCCPPLPREQPHGLPSPRSTARKQEANLSKGILAKQGDSTETNEAENTKWRAVGSLCTLVGASVALMSSFKAFRGRDGEGWNCSNKGEHRVSREEGNQWFSCCHTPLLSGEEQWWAAPCC